MSEEKRSLEINEALALFLANLEKAGFIRINRRKLKLS
jgi:hypothetical protein